MRGKFLTRDGSTAIVCKTKTLGVEFVLLGAIVIDNIYYIHRWTITGISHLRSDFDLLIN